jgi:hypothetical protein
MPKLLCLNWNGHDRTRMAVLCKDSWL